MISFKDQSNDGQSTFTNHVVIFGACIDVHANVLGIGVDWPAKGGNNDICEPPPASHQRDKPLLVTREKLKKYGSIENEVPAGTKSVDLVLVSLRHG